MNIYALFSFHEHGNDIRINLGEKRIVTIQSDNGPTQVEVGLLNETSENPNVSDIIQPTFTNRGGGIFSSFGESDQVVHPKRVVVAFEDVGPVVNPNFLRYDRHTKGLCEIQAGSTYIGLKDAWLKEPAASYSQGNNVYIICLDDVGPYSEFPAKWHTSIDPVTEVQGEDRRSLTQHRLRGGMKYFWNIIVADRPGQTQISTPKPLTKDKETQIRQMAQMSHPNERSERTPRFEKILESMIQREVKVINGKKVYPWIWYFLRGTDRFLNWNATDGIFDVSDEAQNVGWKAFPDVFWAEHHYNLGYDWLLTSIRMWMETKDQLWYEIARRFAEWAFTTGLDWSGKWTGWQWYEKGVRGEEVGSDYWPAPYKQYALGMCLAKLIWEGEWWLDEGWDEFSGAVKRMTAQNMGPDWGERKFAWSMMNCTAIYRVTQDEDYRTNALNRAKEWIGLCKSQTEKAKNFGIVPDSRWDDSEFGMPYIANGASTPQYLGQAWESAKVSQGLLHTLFFAKPNEDDKDLIHRKLLQMGQWLAEDVDAVTTKLIAPRNTTSYDGVPAYYWNGYVQANTPKDIEGNLSWHWAAIGYAALHGIESCKSIYPKVIHDYCTYPELPRNVWISYKFWEDISSFNDVDNDGNYEIDDIGQSLVPLRVGVHKVRVKNILTGQETMHDIVSKDEALAQITINDTHGALSTSEMFSWIVTGPSTHGIRGMNDKAIAEIVETDHQDHENLKNAPFNWSNGQHFNTWLKNMQMILYQWDGPYIIQKLLDIQDERELKLTLTPPKPTSDPIVPTTQGTTSPPPEPILDLSEPEVQES